MRIMFFFVNRIGNLKVCNWLQKLMIRDPETGLHLKANVVGLGINELHQKFKKAVVIVTDSVWIHGFLQKLGFLIPCFTKT